MKKKVATLFAIIAILALVVPTFAQAPNPQVPRSVSDAISEAKAASQVYIVQMAEDPAVSYEGDIPGFPATRPGKGQKINPNSAHVKKYVGFLNSRHNEVLNAVGGGEKLYDYNISFNGFAAKLTPTQAAALQSRADVLRVWVDAARHIETDNSPEFLGLTAGGGLWDQLGGQGSAGEDVIIGVIDTGIWPEHPSFSDQADLSDCPGAACRQTAVYSPPPADWHGVCDSGEQFNQNDCNYKLIGARFYRLGANAATVIPDDYLSPRDRDGHGTHTASTAGGNAGVQASIFGIDRGVVSGIAPRARIAAYKVCWNDAGCFLSDILASIDDAVEDGVDVINYSIGGGASLLGPDDVAYLFAADAGVFVATSAGNTGPGAGTVGGPATVPWITAVGASTQNRTFQGSVVLGSGAEYFGASITGGTDVLPLVDSEDAALDPGDEGSVEDAELCIPGALNPAVVEGNIVLCLRGIIARVDKSRAVFEAGGAGMVLYNENDNQSQVTDNHWVPSVHINNTDGLAVKAYIDSAGNSATARIIGGEKVTIPAPWMADFSSRGPDVVAPDIIKPDVTAPGVNILAGNSPNPFLGAPGQLFQSISGTSMSSPHVAGVAALLRQAHPEWTPEMVKSALMTTGSQDVKKEDGSTPADPFDMGGGHITPNSAADPGLVYEAGFVDYLQFLCGVGALSATGGTCTAVGSIDPSDLNLASIGIAELAGSQTIQRTVTNVGPAATYHVSVDAPAGIDVVVVPESLTVAEGASATYEVTFTTLPEAEINDWSFGSLTWSHGPHEVRSPIAIKPVAIAAPDEVFGAGIAGSLSYEVTFGYTGDFAAEPHGLIPAETQPNTVMDDPSNDIDAALDTCDFSAAFPWPCVGITWHQILVPSGTQYLRVSLFDDYTDGPDDLDLYVYDSDGDMLGDEVGSSGTATSAEEVNIIPPEDDRYFVAVHGWQTDGPDANYTLFDWSLGAADAGNMTVTAPSSATLDATETIMVDWVGLATDMKFLGSITYHDVTSPSGYEDGLIDFTIVRIDTD
ncbi:MAG TPA: S8 family serine peptidase [Anaerolineales bacterium]